MAGLVLASAAHADAPTGYHLVWSDEFDTGDGPDPAKWAYDTDRNKDGWWNGEAEYYSAQRKENARTEDGKLIIEARKDDLNMMADYGGQHYSSARLVTRGKAQWTYGFFDIRAKLPCGKGQWPAIWLLGTGPWPANGEIDIMEAVGHMPTTIYGTLHSNLTDGQATKDKAHQGGETQVPDQCTEFHNYQTEWTHDGITFLVDNTPFYHLDRPKKANQDNWPFDLPEYLILNLAIGGVWGGQQGIDDSRFPQQMQVDYVRIYQK
ncbi:MAG: glycoside hydrolase family 16 protein [Asticcacaulis sp.]|nr:glycoside hydrolase family 16 protein [Asticcacaulis sp.]